MPEPTTATAAAAAASAALATPILTIGGLSLGLRSDLLAAGCAGAAAAIWLLDAVPASNDTVLELLRTSLRRCGFVAVSALTAAYLEPVVGMLLNDAPPAPHYALCFIVGAAAQRILKAVINRTANKVEGA